MSTTFDVYAKNDYIPSFGEVIDAIEDDVSGFLKSHGIECKVSILCELKSYEGEEVLSVSRENTFSWDKSYYLLIRVDDVFGGFDVSFDVVEDSYLEEVYESADINGVLDSIKGMVKQPYFWSFRRTAGQSGIVNIVYGIAAGILAKFTEGVIYSGDCAWESGILPSSGEKFLTFYMEPSETKDSDYKKWAEDCIASVKEDLL